MKSTLDQQSVSLPSGAIGVRLPPAVATRFCAQLQNRSSSDPAAGLLLGSVDRTESGIHILIEDFLPLACARPARASECFQGKNKSVLENALKEWEASSHRPIWAVGYYRFVFHGELELEEADAALVRRNFKAGEAVALLARPQNGDSFLGEFFFHAGGEMVSVNNGPFALNAPSEAVLEAPETLLETTPLWRRHARALGAIVGASLLISAGFAFQRPIKQMLSPRHASELAVAPAVVSAPVAPAAISSPTPPPVAAAAPIVATPSAATPAPKPSPSRELDLRIEGGQGLFRIVWNRDAAAIRDARSGHLTLKSNSSQRAIELSREELSSGSIAFAPGPDDMRISLEIARGSAGVVTATTMVLSGAGARRQPASPEPAPPAEIGYVNLPRSLELRSTAIESRAIEPKPEPLPPAKVEAVKEASIRPNPVAAAPAGAEIQIPGSFPQLGSSSRSPVQPAVKAAPSGEIVLPRLVKSVQPILPMPYRRSILKAPPSVEVTVRIDTAGKVTSATVAGQPGLTAGDALAVAVKMAALDCRFEPARVGGRPVPGDAVIRFHFGN